MSIKKLVIGLVVVAMAFTVTGVAKAYTIEELQTMIAQLTQQMAALGGTSPQGSAIQYNTDLTIGSTGADVTALQQFLVSKGMLQMPAGVAYGYFGPVTKTALARYQASVGINATGYFGPLTRANVNSLVTTTTTTTTTGTETLCPNGKTLASNCVDNPGTTTTTSSTLSGDEGDITVTEKNSGTNSQVAEGEEGAKVVGFEIEADGSDVAITSVKVTMTTPSTGSTRLERYIDGVDIMLGDKVVGSADVGDFSKNGSIYTETIQLSDVVIRENDKDRLSVAVNANADVDTANLSNALTAAVTTVRFEDGSGVVSTETITTVTEDFTLESLTTASSVTLKLSEDVASVNDAHTVQVDATADTNDVELMSFKLKADGSDISLLTLPFTLTGTGAGVTEMINDARVLMDGEEIGDIVIDTGTLGDNDDTFASSTDTEVFITATNLDDDDVVIADGDTATFTFVADLNDTGGAFGNSDSVVVALNADNITGEDENGDAIDTTITSGAVTTGSIAFAASGIMLADFTTSGSPTEIDHIDTTATDNEGLFEMTFEVTAFEDTAFITLTAASSTAAASTDGLAFSMETSADAVAQTGTTTATLERVSGGAVTSNGRLQLDDGQTATLRLKVWHDPSTQAALRVQVSELAFAATDIAGNLAQEATPASDFQSSTLLIHQ